jgi:tetratricopeptide (TPR) repeat protein
MTAATIALLLLAGVAISTWQAIRATSAEEQMRVALQESRGAKAEMEKALEESVQARGQAEAVSKYLIKMFRTPDPREDGWNVKVADLLERAPAELDASVAYSPTTKADLLHALGSTYEGLRLFREAVEMFEKARALRPATLGPDHVDTLQAQRALAAAYRGAGRPDEAIALAEKTREPQVPKQVRQQRLTESLERLVQLYEATRKKDKADKWRKKWEQAKAAPKPTAKP